MKALLLIDIQKDFLPGGSLAVEDGDAVIAPLVALAPLSGLVIASRDFHPPDHSSFLDQGGTWPAHCVAGTDGAQLDPAIDGIATLVVSKATTKEVDAYSAFDGTGLAEFLRGKGVTELVIGGLATDYCVKATVLDALEAGFSVTVVSDGIRAVDRPAGSGDAAIQEMRRAGASFMASREILRSVTTPVLT